MIENSIICEKKQPLEEPIKSVVESQIDQCFEKMQNPFVALHTESKRMQYFFREMEKTFGQTIVKDKFVYTVYSNP